MHRRVRSDGRRSDCALGPAAPVGETAASGLERPRHEVDDGTHPRDDAVGTVVIGRRVGSVDRERLVLVLDGKVDPEDLTRLYESAGSDVLPIRTEPAVARAAAY